ncbi:MAG: OFA family MFS transporter [Phycisphaerae bacterium]|nr:OFA family MFS transporter [Phycisphaerae bacterium]
MKNRWLIAACAVGIHISIGSVYAWSVVTKPIMAEFGWSLKAVSFTFSIAIIFLGLSAAFFGHFVEKKGPRKSGSLAAIFFGLGLAGAGLALHIKSLPLLYLTYGVLGGCGLGTGYITPVSTLIKWFPDKRGMATGMAIMGFGFAALIAGPIMQKLIGSVGLVNMFFILGGAYFLLMFASSQYLSPPPESWSPAGFHEKIQSGKKKIKIDLANLTANEAVKTVRFYFLWLMLFINVTCGIAVISVASPMAQEIVKMTPMAAAAMVGLMGLFNGLGRIGWSSVSDHLGRPAVWVTFFVIQIAAFMFLPTITEAILFQVVIFLILTCYGGGFASVPAYISDVFGTKQVSAIHGYILTAWSAAGLAGPMFASWVRETTNSYSGTLRIFAGLFGVALIISLLMIADMKRLRKKNIMVEQPEAVTA